MAEKETCVYIIHEICWIGYLMGVKIQTYFTPMTAPTCFASALLDPVTIELFKNLLSQQPVQQQHTFHCCKY